MADEERIWLAPGFNPPPELRARAIAWMAEQYKGGASIRAIGQDIGRSNDFVRRNLLKAGVTMRPRSTKQQHPKWVPPKPGDRPRSTR
ncbi:helix-turn-helix domain-containing protein [Streptomyces murinus]